MSNFQPIKAPVVGEGPELIDEDRNTAKSVSLYGKRLRLKGQSLLGFYLRSRGALRRLSKNEPMARRISTFVSRLRSKSQGR
jgi:hypothetical protein